MTEKTKRGQTVKTVHEAAREIPVAYEADVVVVGGGPAGIGSALAAARTGARTILLERFGCLGGMQSQCYNSTFSLVDPEIQGGIVQEIIGRLKKDGAVHKDISDRTRLLDNMGAVYFDVEHYKYLLDNMMAEAGVKLMYHVLGVGAIREGNTLKGVLIESKESRQAILGKIIIDSTGDADIAWKSGAPVMDEGYPRGPKKGRHMGLGYCFFIREVDVERFNKFRQENPDEWGQMFGSEKFIRKAIEEGKLYAIAPRAILREYYGGGRIWVLAPRYPLPMGHHGWTVEDQTDGEIDMRKQAWSLHNLLKNNIPGFENSRIDKTPTAPLLRDTHRMIGEYVLTEEDIRQSRAFEDSIAVSNMFPDLFGPDDEYVTLRDTAPFDIPYRCLVSREVENLMAAGSTISTELIVWAATRYSAPSVCTGQAAGTAAALAVKNKIAPKHLNVKLLQKKLQEDRVPTSIKYVPKNVLDEYHQSAERRRGGMKTYIKRI